MMIQVESKTSPVNSSDVTRLEAEIGQALPHVYRSFLMTTNVAIPERNQIALQSGYASVAKFWGISQIANDSIAAARVKGFSA